MKEIEIKILKDTDQMITDETIMSQISAVSLKEEAEKGAVIVANQGDINKKEQGAIADNVWRNKKIF